MLFPKTLLQRETQIASFWIWTWFTNSISYDSRYTKQAPKVRVRSNKTMEEMRHVWNKKKGFILIYDWLIYRDSFRISFICSYITYQRYSWEWPCEKSLHEDILHIWVVEKDYVSKKWCTLMDPHTWPCKSRSTSMNIHPAAMWGYGMLSWRPT